MNRRTFIAGLGSAAVWPAVTRGQQAALPVIGFLHSGAGGENDARFIAFRRGLAEQGFVVGRNVEIVYAAADNQLDRLLPLAADLAKRNVALIVASGGPSPAQAAKAITATIPIVFETGRDPVLDGLVTSLNRPGGNVTGINSLIAEGWLKQFDLITNVLPNGRTFALFYTGIIPGRAELLRKEAQSAAEKIGRKLIVVTATRPQEVDEAFSTLPGQAVEGLIVSAQPFVNDQREKFAALAARYAIPAIYPYRENAEAGGLMSYSVDFRESYRLVGTYSGRILRGEKPADLPVQQATKFELILNLKTAKALGLNLPATILARADEVIE
jgi:putative ABC transport system substrate-binding protein